MTAESVARNLRLWAVQNGLLDREQLGPNADTQLRAMSVVGITPLRDEVPELLRPRRINFVGFNNMANEVVIYTTKAVQRRVKPKLPSAADDGVSISYQIGAPELIGKLPPSPFGTAPATLHNGRYTCGSSIHVGNRLGAGTLGCLVRTSDGAMYGLTNNHVTGNCNFASPGLPILAPGPCDVAVNGVDPFCIGHHARSLRMVHGTPDNPLVRPHENTDAALFRIADESRVTSLQKDGAYDTPSVVGPIAPGMVVSKVGRTTGHTGGVVRSQISGPFHIRYKMPELEIDLAVFYEPLFVVQAQSGFFAAPGDSGALVTTMDGGTRRAVGLVVAGDGSNPAVSFILPLQPIVQGFGATLVSGHNV